MPDEKDVNTPMAEDSPSAPPQAAILQITGQVLPARCIGVVAELNVAEHLANEPKTAADLAKKCGAHAPTLYRILRYLASIGIFEERPDGTFVNTPQSDVLRDGVPGSVRMLVRQRWQDVTWDVYRALPEAVASPTGIPAFDLAHGNPFFDFLAENLDLNALFDAAMAMMSGPENDVIAATFPFEGVSRVCDIGGGQGGLLAAILKRHSNIHGVLFDQSQVIAEPAHLNAAGMIDRCDLIAGDFFETAPPDCDVYLLKRILHDWSDADAGRILTSVREAMPGDGRVVIIDALLKPGNEPDPNKFLDLGIMALLRGRERTESEMKDVLNSARFELETVYPPEAPSTLSMTVGKPA